MTKPKKSLMRSLGEFTGHIVKAIRQPAKKETRTIRHEQTETRSDDVVLRRTVIEEIEMPADDRSGDDEKCS
jgi:hypothetical protein